MKPQRPFETEFRDSQDPAVETAVTALLANIIPGAIGVDRAPPRADRLGVDYWVRRAPPRFPLGVDLKSRREDWLPKGYDDLALETWSVVDSRVIGWTRDTHKATDLVLWYWRDTRRWVILPFLPLCLAFTRYWQTWYQAALSSNPWYKVERQRSSRHGEHWQSECVIVPRRVVWQAMAATCAAPTIPPVPSLNGQPHPQAGDPLSFSELSQK